MLSQIRYYINRILDNFFPTLVTWVSKKDFTCMIFLTQPHPLLSTILSTSFLPKLLILNILDFFHTICVSPFITK